MGMSKTACFAIQMWLLPWSVCSDRGGWSRTMFCEMNTAVLELGVKPLCLSLNLHWARALKHWQKHHGNWRFRGNLQRLGKGRK